MKDYRPRLDGLRFVAISAVLIEHFGSYLANFFIAGYYGVDLFFVISGYLITGILLRSGDQPFGQVYRAFLGRRALRIFPPYYLLLIVLMVVGLAPARQFLLSLATYTFNYHGALYRGPDGQNPLFYLWSLSVEEQFYFVWPPIVIALRRQKRLLLLSIALVVAAGYAQLSMNIIPALSPYNYTGLFSRMGSLGLGAFGAVYSSWNPRFPERIFRSKVVEALVLFVLIVALVTPIPLRFPVLGIASLFLVLKASRFEFWIRPIDALLTHPFALYIGKISYGMYLFHVPLGLLLTNYFFDPIWSAIPFEQMGPLGLLKWHSWVVKLPLYSALTIVVAGASYRWFESPILELKDRWFGSVWKGPSDATSPALVNPQ